jgi:hypothetical protein
MANELYDECIESCLACAIACEHCELASLSAGEGTSAAECIQLSHDCAEICRLAAGWMTREGRFAATICEVCAVVCTACAAECGKHSTDHCRACAQACRNCAELCRRMVGGAIPEVSTSIGLTG